MHEDYEAQRYALKLVTSPATEPITLSEAKAQLRVDFSTDDTEITTMIITARKAVEKFLRRQLVTATWDLFLDQFPEGGGVIEVPLPPLQSITTLKYLDENGNQQTWSSTNYRVDVKSEPGRIERAWGVSYPGIRTIANAVEIRFVAGFGAAAAVPEDIKHGILMLLADLYEHRERQAEEILNFNRVYRELLTPNRILTAA